MELIDFEAVVDDIDKLELDYEEDTDNLFFLATANRSRVHFYIFTENFTTRRVKFLIR